MFKAVRKNIIQRKLQIGQPNDRFEQEADQVADHVMNTPQKNSSSIQRKCASCKVEELQMKPYQNDSSQIIQKQEEEEEMVQMKSSNSKNSSTTNLETSLHDSKGGGQNLDTTTQKNMSESLGADFSNVKVHTNNDAIKMNQNLNAKAFTNGADVYFNQGQYNPQSSEGKHLLIHELAHVVQQGGQSSLVQRQPKYSRKGKKAQKIFWTDLQTSTEPGMSEFKAKISATGYDKDQKSMLKIVPSKNNFEVILGKKFLTEKDATVRLAVINAKIKIFKQKLDAKKIATAKKAIVDTFKVKSVNDDTANWTEAELILTKAALTAIPAADLWVLEGIVIDRVSSLGGTTAGEFIGHYKLGKEDTEITESRTMKLANLTFSGSNQDENKRIIIHEVGHAVASAKRHKANIEHGKALLDSNPKSRAATDSWKRYNKSKKELKKKKKELAKKKRAYRREKDPDKKKVLMGEVESLKKSVATLKTDTETVRLENVKEYAIAKPAERISKSKKAAADALKISPTDLAAIKRGTDKSKRSHSSKLTAAKAAVTKITISDSDVQSYNDAIIKVSTELDTFYTTAETKTDTIFDIGSHTDTIENSIKERKKTKGVLTTKSIGANVITAFASLEKIQDSFFLEAQKYAQAKRRPMTVHKFYKFVKRYKIAPITPYALKNWPHKPEEFYAEAYSYWVTGKLEAKSKKLNKWFKDGKYK